MRGDLPLALPLTPLSLGGVEHRELGSVWNVCILEKTKMVIISDSRPDLTHDSNPNG